MYPAPHGSCSQAGNEYSPSHTPLVLGIQEGRLTGAVALFGN